MTGAFEVRHAARSGGPVAVSMLMSSLQGCDSRASCASWRSSCATRVSSRRI
jgi:hypothetical protein